MPVSITALYTAVLVLLVGFLSFQVGKMRDKTSISILHGDNIELAEKIRRHGNAIEYVPIALLLMLVLELNGATSIMLHSLGVVLVLSRIAHAIGHPTRAVGALGTALVIVVGSGAAIYQLITAWIQAQTLAVGGLSCKG